jgi:hypothetical protein
MAGLVREDQLHGAKDAGEVNLDDRGQRANQARTGRAHVSTRFGTRSTVFEWASSEIEKTDRSALFDEPIDFRVHASGLYVTRK